MTAPTPEEQQRAKMSLLLLDIEHRTEQVRQLKRYEPWRLAFAGMTAGAAIFGVGLAFGHLFW
jgi:hypothetical protein